MPLDRREFIALGSGGLLLGRAASVFPARSETGKPRLMQGPMLGASEPDRIRVWARASEPVDLTVEVSADRHFSSVTRASARALTDEDLTAVVTVSGLQPRTRYFYRVLVNGRPDPYLGPAFPFEAHTAPQPGEPVSFTVAFGSCARYAVDPVQPIWRHVLARSPDLFLWLGDNIYADSLNPLALAEEYRRQRGVPSLQPLARRVPQLAIWDDHDYALNDHDRTNPMRDAALQSFRRYWANPSYGLPQTPGVFFRYRYGAVDFFMLDGRSYRDPNRDPDEPGKTLLGETQRQWLERELAASTAVFKILACGSGWTKAKGPGGDSWAAFLHERDALFDFIRDRDIGGVVLLSGDTHVGELNAIPRSEQGGYDLYDLVSSPLAQGCDDSWFHRAPERRIRPVHFASANFGLLRLELSGRPRLVYELVDAFGRSVWTPLELGAHELRNGVTSWRAKSDPPPAAS